MRYTSRFTVAAPLAAVRNFHRRSASMGAITPPPVVVRMHRAPALLQEGDEMEFTMWLGPLPVRWLAAIEAVTEQSFVDRQVRGPFKQWVHKHTFVPVDKQTTTVHDEISAELSDQPFWRMVGRLMWLNMPVLFAFRRWKTTRLLRRGTASAVES